MRLFVVMLVALAGLVVAGPAAAGQKCPSIELASGPVMAVGVGGGVSCEEAHETIVAFYDWYEHQNGRAQQRTVGEFRCGRASGTLGCQGQPKWIYADSHVGARPWTWAPPWAPEYKVRDCGSPKWSRIKRGGTLTTRGGVKCGRANRVTRKYLKRIQEPKPRVGGFVCTGGQVHSGRGSDHFIECKRAKKTIFWVGPSRAIGGPGTPFGQGRYPKGRKLKRSEARRYMRRALKREFGSRWTRGYSKTTRCVKRVSRWKITCTRLGWLSGDTGFSGRGTIWLKNGTWNYSFRILRVNEYCALVEHRPFKECARWVVVK